MENLDYVFHSMSLVYFLLRAFVSLLLAWHILSLYWHLLDASGYVHRSWSSCFSPSNPRAALVLLLIFPSKIFFHFPPQIPQLLPSSLSPAWAARNSPKWCVIHTHMVLIPWNSRLYYPKMDILPSFEN